MFRDLAIAQELRKILKPEDEIIFASGGTAYEMLKEEGVHVEKISSLDFPVHLGTADFFKFYMVMLLSEFQQILDLRRLIKKYRPALVVLDEYFFLADYCRLRGIPAVFICDFVGLPHCSFFRNPVRSILERVFDFLLTHWLPRRTNRWIFTGDNDHIPRKDWQDRARSVGIVTVEPITKLQYTPPPTREEAREKLGFDDNERVVTISVGCTGAGEYLLMAANEAGSLLKDKVPRLRMELICGKGIDSGALQRTANPGVYVHDYVRNLQEYFAASDAAVVQCGLTSVTECLMLDIPIVVVPLANHWEQANTARYVSQKFGVKSIEAPQAAAAILADALLELLEQPKKTKSPFRGDGAILRQRELLLTCSARGMSSRLDLQPEG
ncbi:MAG TPA: glycosyltransferase [Candidatus Sulfobium mesophilum]|nr:glycosyltransferase [Candidatus Sulfobium mesophilum]